MRNAALLSKDASFRKEVPKGFEAFNQLEKMASEPVIVCSFHSRSFSNGQDALAQDTTGKLWNRLSSLSSLAFQDRGGRKVCPQKMFAPDN
jgi:hypothetical protein